MTSITEPWASGPHEPDYEVCDGCGNDLTDDESQANTHPLKVLCAACLAEWIDKQTDEE